MPIAQGAAKTCIADRTAGRFSVARRRYRAHDYAERGDYQNREDCVHVPWHRRSKSPDEECVAPKHDR